MYEIISVMKYANDKKRMHIYAMHDKIIIKSCNIDLKIFF